MPDRAERMRAKLDMASLCVEYAACAVEYANKAADIQSKHVDNAIEVLRSARTYIRRARNEELPALIGEPPEDRELDAPLSVTLEELVSYIGAVKVVTSELRDGVAPVRHDAKIHATGNNIACGEHAGVCHAILVAFVELVRTFRIVDGELVYRAAEADDVEAE